MSSGEQDERTDRFDSGVYKSAMDRPNVEEMADAVGPLPQRDGNIEQDLIGEGSKIKINYSAAKQSDFSSIGGAAASVRGNIPPGPQSQQIPLDSRFIKE